MEKEHVDYNESKIEEKDTLRGKGIIEVDNHSQVKWEDAP